MEKSAETMSNLHRLLLLLSVSLLVATYADASRYRRPVTQLLESVRAARKTLDLTRAVVDEVDPQFYREQLVAAARVLPGQKRILEKIPVRAAILNVESPFQAMGDEPPTDHPDIVHRELSLEPPAETLAMLSILPAPPGSRYFLGRFKLDVSQLGEYLTIPELDSLWAAKDLTVYVFNPSRTTPNGDGAVNSDAGICGIAFESSELQARGKFGVTLDVPCKNQGSPLEVTDALRFLSDRARIPGWSSEAYGQTYSLMYLPIETALRHLENRSTHEEDTGESLDVGGIKAEPRLFLTLGPVLILLWLLYMLLNLQILARASTEELTDVKFWFGMFRGWPSIVCMSLITVLLPVGASVPVIWRLDQAVVEATKVSGLGEDVVTAILLGVVALSVVFIVQNVRIAKRVYSEALPERSED